MREKISKLINVYKKYGFLGFLNKLKMHIKANYIDRISLEVLFNKRKYKKIIKDILTNNEYERIILWRSSFGYNVPLFQRPQHIANNLSKNKCLVFYEVTDTTDKIKTVQFHQKNLYLINFNNIFLNNILKKEIKEIKKPRYLQMYSTDWKMSVKDIKKYIDDGYKFIYEYIDDLSPEIAGTKQIPKNIIEKYEYAMKDKNVYIIVTADLLKQDVIKHRGEKNLAFATNGVDYNFFQSFDNDFKFDKEFQKIIDLKRPIIMYYGALAKWFDYELIKKIARTNKYSIVLFGIKYDESFDKNIKKDKNIYFLGSRDYKILKYYASKAALLVIPFLINDITNSTSPVKIFEYMALKKPILTTNILECRKYKSVVIAKTHEDFLDKIEPTIKRINNKEYINLLDKDAKDNDWENKAKAIIELIKNGEQ